MLNWTAPFENMRVWWVSHLHTHTFTVTGSEGMKDDNLTSGWNTVWQKECILRGWLVMQRTIDRRLNEISSIMKREREKKWLGCIHELVNKWRCKCIMHCNRSISFHLHKIMLFASLNIYLNLSLSRSLAYFWYKMVFKPFLKPISTTLISMHGIFYGIHSTVSPFVI